VRSLSRIRKFELLGILLFIIIAPIIFNGSYALHLINIIGIYAITIIGLDLLVGLTGLISLGHAVFFAGAGYLTAYLNITMSLSPIVACVITILLISILAVVTGIPLLRLKGYFLALGTLGFGVVIYTLIKGISIIGGPNGLGGIPNFSIGFFEFKGDLSYFFLIWTTVLLVFLFVNNISNSRIGRALKAIHSDENTAMAFGIRVVSYKMIVYVISAAIAAISGVYYGHYIQFVSPSQSSLATSVDLVVMLFLGGIGTVFGPILGTFIYQLIPEVLSTLHDYEVLFRGVLLLLVLLFFPKGLYPGIQRILKQISVIISSRKSSEIGKLKNDGKIKKLG
jgi:branched-chain amino acid transport system permease protein